MPRNLEVRKGVRELALRLGTAHSRCVLSPIFTESGHTTTRCYGGASRSREAEDVWPRCNPLAPSRSSLDGSSSGLACLII